MSGAHYPASSAVKAGGEWGVPKYIGGSTTGGADLPATKTTKHFFTQDGSRILALWHQVTTSWAWLQTS
jgi:hypothetical protein